MPSAAALASLPARALYHSRREPLGFRVDGDDIAALAAERLAEANIKSLEAAASHARLEAHRLATLSSPIGRDLADAARLAEKRATAALGAARDALLCERRGLTTAGDDHDRAERDRGGTG